MTNSSLTPEFEPVRVGMIGVGRHARAVLLPALALVPELRLCCVATAHLDTARLAAERYRVKAYLGFENLLDHPDLEAVLVVGGQHGPEMGACLDAGLHVWCETPAVDSSETARYLREQAAAADRIVEVGSCLRHAPVYRQLARLLEEWRAASPEPRLFQAQYYPYIGHFYNLLLYLNGPIDSVLAAKGGLETIVTLRFANGDLGSVVSRRFENDSIPFESLAVSGPTGLLSASNGRDLVFHRSPEGRTASQLAYDVATGVFYSPTFSMPYGGLNQLYLRGYIPELQYFARRVRQGLPPVCGITEMEQTLLVSKTVDRSAVSGTWETVREGE
jgi:predicted dehydrogenase